MKTFMCFAGLVALAAFAEGAAQFSFDGRWLSNGVVQSNMTTTCTVRFYSAEGAQSATQSRTGVALKTDSDGYFVISCEVPSGLPDVFWTGIVPQGGNEILPRSKVAPVPFAIAAASAKLVKDDNLVELTGTAAIHEINTTGNVTTDGLTLPLGGKIDVRNFTTPNVYVDTISFGNCCMFGLFNIGNGTSLTPDFSAMSADYQLGAKVQTTKGGFLSSQVYYHDNSSAIQFVTDKDGFVLISVKSDKRDCPYCSLSLGNSTTQLISDLQFASETRFITVPCRRRESFSLSLLAKSTGGKTGWWSTDDNLIGSISVKIKFIYFGL